METLITVPTTIIQTSSFAVGLVLEIREQINKYKIPEVIKIATRINTGCSRRGIFLSKNLEARASAIKIPAREIPITHHKSSVLSVLFAIFKFF